MSGYRLLLDENVEHEVRDREAVAGHDVVHVDRVAELGKGASDEALARWAAERDRTIVTYDDFVDGVPESAYRAVLFFEDDTVAAAEVAAVIDAMSTAYPHDVVTGLQKTGREWL